MKMRLLQKNKANSKNGFWVFSKFLTLIIKQNSMATWKAKKYLGYVQAFYLKMPVHTWHKETVKK